jgi:hypothetical protein
MVMLRHFVTLLRLFEPKRKKNGWPDLFGYHVRIVEAVVPLAIHTG